jgi:hypothetical protein
MNWTHGHHLAYCTNIHPAETWAETFNVLETDVLAVRDRLKSDGLLEGSFAIGLRLSAQAAVELLEGERLSTFKNWLAQNDCYLFTINGFPYGSFHGTRVKEQVYQPDWTTGERLEYTSHLFALIAELCPAESGGSVSTLPASFKEFEADENLIFANLYAVACGIEDRSMESGKDLHLGLEPEPLGHFENTAETLAFFERFHDWCDRRELSTEVVKKRIGLNYDCCHFAIEFDDCRTSLEAFREAGIRISKVHLSSALEFDPNDANSLTALQTFDEPTYLHQVILSGENGLQRARDLPEFFQGLDSGLWSLDSQSKARCHFHVPLYAEAADPLGTTQNHVRDLLAYREEFPDFCQHFEIETYTWGVLPESLQTDLTSQIVQEFEWILA